MNVVYLRFITMYFALGKGTTIKQRTFLPLAYTIRILGGKIVAPQKSESLLGYAPTAIRFLLGYLL